MKYMIMMFGDQATMMETQTPEWIRSMIEFMTKVDEDLRKSGELVDGQGLADPSQAKTVRTKDGLPVATDGPFAEAKESLAGFWVVDVENEARALEIASTVVAFIHGPIEVRQVMDAPRAFPNSAISPCAPPALARRPETRVSGCAYALVVFAGSSPETPTAPRAEGAIGTFAG